MIGKDRPQKIVRPPEFRQSIPWETRHPHSGIISDWTDKADSTVYFTERKARILCKT
jgi:hypothetical protein